MATGLVSKGEEAFVVVVSHDCDLAQDPSAEAEVEVIVGRSVPEANGNLSHAKNARRLHLSLTGGTRSVVVDLRSNGKKLVLKTELGGKHPSSDVRPKPFERVILQRWLASRYRRSSFADEFDQRLDALGLREAMAKALKKNGKLISAVYFDVDEGQQLSRTQPEDTYVLSIYLLYDTTYDPEVAERAALKAAKDISEAFHKKCCSPEEVWAYIELDGCEAIADNAMTVQLADKLARWSADHISLRADPPTTMRQDD